MRRYDASCPKRSQEIYIFDGPIGRRPDNDPYPLAKFNQPLDPIFTTTLIQSSQRGHPHKDRNYCLSKWLVTNNVQTRSIR